MKKRVFSLLLALVMCLSFLPTIAMADSENHISIEIDLSGYPYEFHSQEFIVVGLEHGAEHFETLTAGDTQTFRYSLDDDSSYLILMAISLDPDYPVDGWVINGIEYKDSASIDKAEISVDGDYFEICLEDSVPGIWTIAPLLPQSEHTVTAISNDPNQGAVTALDLGDDTYKLQANAKDGWSLDYWIDDDEPETQIRKNPHIVKLESSKTYTAYFKQWNTAAVSADPTGAGTVTAERVLDDIWKLTAQPNWGYVFNYWSSDGAMVSSTQAGTFDLDSDTVYTAHFVPWQITGISSLTASAGGGEPTGTEGSAPLRAGTGVTVRAQLNANTSPVFLPHSWVEVYAGDEAAVKAETARLLGRVEDEGDGERNAAFLGGIPEVTIDPWPASGIDEITMVAYTDNCEKHYATLSVSTAPAGQGLDLAYLSTPRNSAIGAGAIPSGPDIYGVAAFLNKQTGRPSVYAAGLGGVYELGYGGQTGMVRMPGMTDLITSGANLSDIGYALAVGGPDVGDLTALVRVPTTIGSGMEAYTEILYVLRRYDAAQGKWITVEGSTMPKTGSEKGNLEPSGVGAVNSVLVMDGDNVWTDKAHWDGTVWTAHGYTFVSFFKTDESTAYGAAQDGSVYSYSVGAGWTKADGLSGSLMNVSADGKLLIRKSDSSYSVVKNGDTEATYPAISPSVLGDVQTPDGLFVPRYSRGMNIYGAGFGGDEKVYALLEGSSRTYILQAKADGWELMDTVDAFALEDATEFSARPTTLTSVANAAEGITVFFGSDGAFYLQSVEYTITFSSNGGSAVNPIKGVVWSAVDVPIPTREGYTFAGWYYDDTTFDSPWSETVIPASNLTLYAKWTAKEGGGAPGEVDEYAEDREKALNQLDQSLARMDSKDYSSANWQTVLKEYNNGVYAIGVAKPKPASEDIDIINKAVADTIYAALNAAINRMNAVPVQSVGNITVAVSVDANTLGLGYLVRPTLVTIPKYTRASKVVTDLLSQNGYSWTNTGTVNSAFYLSGIRPVDQTKAKPADFLQGISGFSFNNSDKTDRTLGEFDYNNWSGWMYSVGDGGNGEYPSFPGIGSAEYRMINGEVMRWQFTLYGYGADLNAENSAWGTSSVISSLGNKSELTWEVASLRKSKSDTDLEKDSNFIKAIKVLEDPAATQEEIDSAYNALISQSGSTGGSTGGDATVTTNPAVTVDEKGTASVDLNAKDMKAIIDRAKDEEAISIIIEPEIEGNASKVAVALPRASVEEIAKNTKAVLVVKTGIADVKISTASLADLGGRGGSAVTISAESLKDKNGKATGQVKVEIKSGDIVITQLSGGISATLPVAEPTSGTVLVLVTDEGAKIIRKAALDGKTITALLDGSCTLVVKDNTKAFTDTKNHWAADSITFASSHELFQGVTATEFAPGANMSRAMLATVLWRLENEADAAAGNSFNDVVPDSWYSDAVLWASQNKIVDGYGSGLFGTNDNITREQLATMLYRYAKHLDMGMGTTGDLSKFSDGRGVPTWAFDAMKWAVGSGLIGGKGDGKLDPSGNATRAEVAAIMQRMVKLMVN